MACQNFLHSPHIDKSWFKWNMANEFSKPYCSTNNLYSEAIHFLALSSLLRPLKQMHV